MKSMSKAKKLKGSDEATLVNGLLRDEPAAWRELLRDYSTAMRSASRKVVRRVANHLPSDLAQDIEQQVLLKLLQNDKRALRAFDPAKATFRTYVNRIASNLALDELATFLRCGAAIDLDRLIEWEGADPDDDAGKGGDGLRSIDLDYWIGARRAARKAVRTTTGGAS